MLSFLQENLVLVLAVTGTVTSFAIFFIKKVARIQKVRPLLILATLGLLILTGQQVIEYLERINQAFLQEARVNIVEDIRKKGDKNAHHGRAVS